MLRLSAPTCFSRLPLTAPPRQPFQVHCVRLRLIALVIPNRHSALGQDFPHPTSTAAAIVVSRRCFICLNPCSRSSSIGVNPLLGIIVPNHSVFRVDQMIGWSPHCNLINVAIDEQHVADEISRMMHLSADKMLGFTVYKIVGIN